MMETIPIDGDDAEWQAFLAEFDQGEFGKVNEDDEPPELIAEAHERQRDIRSGKRPAI